MHLDQHRLPLSQIIVNASLEAAVEHLKQVLAPYKHEIFYPDSFLLEHAKQVVKAAYVAESEIKYLVLVAHTFSVDVQNSLLKILEEPPRNIRFILVVPSKTVLLPTVLSRLLFWHEKGEKPSSVEIPFDFSRLDLEQVYTFIKQHERIGKLELQHLLEAMFIKASHERGRLTLKQCEVFETAYKLLHVNAKTQTLLTTVLLQFIV